MRRSWLNRSPRSAPRRLRGRYSWLACAALALAPLASARAGAETEEASAASASVPVEGSLVFARGEALWRVPVNAGRAGGKRAVQLAPLPSEAGALTGLIASPRGNAVVATFERGVSWLALNQASPRLRPLACVPPAFFSRDGRLACAGADGRLALYASLRRTARAVPLPGARLAGFAADGRLLLADERGLWAVAADDPGQRTQLAPHVGARGLRVGPRGRRAAAWYAGVGTHPIPGLYTFALDEKATRRRLLAEAKPVAWASGGGWLAVQSEEEGACLVRVVGGQYKCWRRYRAVSISPKGAFLLMVKPEEKEREGADASLGLYIGEGEGVRPAAPRLVVDGVSRHAVWVAPCAAGCR